MYSASADRGGTRLTFIGGGTMACAILDGLGESPETTSWPETNQCLSISITARRRERAIQLSQRYPKAYVTTSNANEKLWHFDDDAQPAAHIVLICTKPQQTSDVCEDIRRAHQDVSKSGRCALPTVVTMCPGITNAKLESWLNPGSSSMRFPIIRTMPNTPVSIRQGATAIVASPYAQAADVKCVADLFRVISPCVEVLPKEDLLDIAAAVSGSGPAYIFQFYKCLVAAGAHWGLPEHLTHALVMQTGVGASMLVNGRPDTSLSSMIAEVCVPGGSTEKGIKCLEDVGLQAAVTKAVSSSLEANHGMGG